MKKALIFGVTGQDGSYLSELLIKKNYEVIGVKRRSSSINTGRIDHLIENFDNFKVQHGDITDTASVFSLVAKEQPHEIYNLAAQSHVGVSFNEPEYTAQVDAVGTLRILEAIKQHSSHSRFYQASTSELFGGLSGNILDENTVFNPRSPYAAAKLYSYYITKQYREGFGIKAYNGILFNHESPRRGENFVSRKITLEMGNIVNGRRENIALGNLDSVRDWGHAKDYVNAMYQMLMLEPDDYVVSTGNCYSVRDFLVTAFKYIGVVLEFKGMGINEYAEVKSVTDTNLSGKIKVGQKVVKVDEKYFRPLEVPHLLGSSKKFRDISGWKEEYSFEDLVKEMVYNDVKYTKNS